MHVTGFSNYIGRYDCFVTYQNIQHINIKLPVGLLLEKHDSQLEMYSIIDSIV